MFVLLTASLLPKRMREKHTCKAAVFPQTPCSYHKVCGLLGIYSTTTMSGHPTYTNTLSQRPPPRLQPHVEESSHLLLDFNLPLSFHYVLWERIRPGFPQVPQFHSMAGRLFHLQPHVEADKRSSDTSPT